MCLLRGHRDKEGTNHLDTWIRGQQPASWKHMDRRRQHRLPFHVRRPERFRQTCWRQAYKHTLRARSRLIRVFRNCNHACLYANRAPRRRSPQGSRLPRTHRHLQLAPRTAACSHSQTRTSTSVETHTRVSSPVLARPLRGPCTRSASMTACGRSTARATCAFPVCCWHGLSLTIQTTM